jgi:hypothetical protein
MWDFSLSSFTIDPYSTHTGTTALALLVLEGLVLLFLVVESLATLRELLGDRTYSLLQHLALPGHWFRAGLAALMWYGWWLKVACWSPAGRDLVPDPEYPVLADPQARSAHEGRVRAT